MAATINSHIPNQALPILAKCCRKCSFRYEFRLPNNQIVTILCGQPRNIRYKAVSYTWEHYTWLPLKCQKCSEVTEFPMRDATKLWRILEFVRGDSVIWLDALSIDQKDKKDLDAQLEVMGDIYRQAEVVSVLFPKSDGKAYEVLKRLGVIADGIVRRAKDFGMSLDGTVSDPPADPDVLIQLADSFKAEVRTWKDNIHNWSYFQRAWTFQEWAMACEMEVACEAVMDHEGFFGAKNTIPMASTIVGHWQNIQAKVIVAGTYDESLTEQMNMREQVGRDLNIVSALFPFQDFLIADTESTSEELRSMTLMTGLASATDSGTNITLPQLKRPNSDKIGFRAMLSLALSAISMSQRKARFPADLVASWASACNIKYEYDRHDSFAVALQKVVGKIRAEGITIFSFVVNTNCADVDLKFLDYAAVQQQMNTSSKGFLFGPPIFTGRADTATHVRLLLENDGQLTHLESSGTRNLRVIERATIEIAVTCGKRVEALVTFRDLITGKIYGNRLSDVGDDVEVLWGGTSFTCLDKHQLITISIPVINNLAISRFKAWAMCPSSIKSSDIFIAREDLNGTLVLAVHQGRGEPARIVAYLNMTNQKEGTYLVRADEKGVVDIVFKKADPFMLEIPGLPDMSTLLGLSKAAEWNVMDDIEDRALGVQIEVGDQEFSCL